MKKGVYYPDTLRKVAVIRRLRAEGLALREIAPHVGVTWNRVWQLCRQHGITSPRDYGVKRKSKPRPGIAPEIVAKRAAALAAYWRRSA